jgi:hypothetical protein
MASVKLLFRFLWEVLATSIWGLTVIDLIKVQASADFLLNLDVKIKTAMALAGLIYFLIQIPHKIKTQIQDRELKKEQIKKIKKENDKKD